MGQQKLLPLRSRRIVEESQLRDVQCRLPLLLAPDLELGTEGKGKYEEEKKEEVDKLSWRAAGVFIVPGRCRRELSAQAVRRQNYCFSGPR